MQLVKLETYRDMGVSCIPLGISCRENSVDKNKGADNFSCQTGSSAVSFREAVGSSSILIVVRLLECLHQSTSTDGSQTLSNHVQYGSDQGHLPSQEKPKGHCWIDVSPCIFDLNC